MTKWGRVEKQGQIIKRYVCIAMSVSFLTGDGEPRDQDFLKIILEATYRMTGGRETDQETMTFLSYWDKELIVLINTLILKYKWVILKCL